MEDRSDRHLTDGLSWVTGRRVLVTGGAGFAGSHLSERLAALGANVRATARYTSSGHAGWLEQSPVRDDLEIVRGDVRDADFVERAMRDIEIVFHLAALVGIPHSYEAPQAYVATNITGTLNVLQTALARGAALVVHTSTSEVYGTALYVPMDEQHPLQAQSPYSATKIAADKIAESFHRSFGLPIVTVRPFNMYGPRQSARAIIPTIITQAMTQPSVRLGNVTSTRDLTYVTDAVEGFVRLAGAPAAVGQVVNLGTGVETSVGGLAASIIAAVGRDVAVEQDPQRLRPVASEVDRLCADPRKAAELAGWHSRHSLEDGLRTTLEWFADNAGRYRPEMFSV